VKGEKTLAEVIQHLAVEGDLTSQLTLAENAEMQDLIRIRYIRPVTLDLHSELRGIVAALDAAGIAYALVGGLAVSIYAAPRATEDVDLLLGREQLATAVERLVSLGFRRASAPMSVAGGRLEIQRLIKIHGSDLVPVDLLIADDPALAAILASREGVVWEGGRLSIVSLAGLRTLKRLRGSAQDLADLEALGPEA
jgi:hypothetical protein